ncbi:hypothetical protein BHM03_00018638, partial [Ensete ventricosum]
MTLYIARESSKAPPFPSKFQSFSPFLGFIFCLMVSYFCSYGGRNLEKKEVTSVKVCSPSSFCPLFWYTVNLVVFFIDKKLP